MNNIKILKLMLENKEKKFSINQISNLLKINYRIAHEQTKLLEKEDLIKLEKVGKSLLCSLTGNFNEKIFFAEYLRKQEILSKKDFKLILKRFSEARQNYILLLFGSYVNNIETKFSDIDLLAITENEKEIRDISELIPKKIHLTIVNYKTFIEMIKIKELNVGNEAQKNNIILIGIEDYYRLLENVN
jgi:predicted nucleotidyltransferase